MYFHLVVTSVLCLIKGSNGQGGCITYEEIVTTSVLKSAVTYMNDNPLAVENPVGYDHDFLTPSSLYSAYSNEDMDSPKGFMKAIREIVYTPRNFDDGTDVRSSTYYYISENNGSNGRRKLGNLLKIIGERSDVGSSYWGTEKCIPSDVTVDLQVAISIELKK